jgi:RNA recognition motif-containing protein
MNIYVSNLNYKVNDNQLRELFAPYGEVTSAKVITDKFTGKSRGFGFVEMKSDEEGQAAIDKLNKSQHEGMELNVTLARPREERPSRSFNGGGGGKRNFNKRY